MPSPRWLAKLAPPIMAGAALVPSSAIATDDPVHTGERAQLQGSASGCRAMRALIGMAQLICDDLGWGWTPDQIAQSVHANLDGRGIHYGQVAAMVNLARSTYCPNQRCWAAHC
jgi:hypothetical protein